LLDRINAFLLEFGHALIENGANVLFIPEPSASASMISPAMFRRFVLPRLQFLASQFNVPCVLHICGDTSRTGGINRFVLMSGCGVPPATSIENLRAMVKTAIDYGLGT
jgi:uroporphyrinogen-III decarboxylase